MNISDFVQAVIVGICSGIGSTIGSFIAIKYFVEHMDKIPTVKEKIRQLLKNDKDRAVQSNPK